MIGRIIGPFLKAVRDTGSSIARPLFRRFYLPYSHAAHVGGFRLEIPPGVFPAGLFLSSKSLSAEVGRRPLGGKRVLDMGTGSGVVGIHAARAGASVLAVDIDPVAVECARANALLNDCRSMECRRSDLFSSITAGEKFDLIAWNPPFYPTDPRGPGEDAWFAGEGYSVLRRFSGEAADRVLPGGVMLLALSSDMDLPLLWSVLSGDGWRMFVEGTHRGIFADHFVVEMTR